MSYTMEDYYNDIRNDILKGYYNDIAQKAREEEQKKIITVLLKKGFSAELIFDTWHYPIELIEQVQKEILRR